MLKYSITIQFCLLVVAWKTQWVDNIKMDVGEIGWSGVECIGLALDRDK
jgi:hypothetical protein